MKFDKIVNQSKKPPPGGFYREKEGIILKNIKEMQGFDVIPEDVEDEIHVRDENGELVRIEVNDDVNDD